MSTFRLPSVLALAAILAPTTLLLAVIARSHDAIHVPLAMRCALAAFVLFALMVLRQGRWPQLSLRLLHAAITVAALTYVLAPVALVHALRVLPSATGALALASVPLALLILQRGRASINASSLGIAMLGILVGIGGSYEASSARGSIVLATIALAVATGSHLLGVWVSRRLFWLHAALDLNFWSLCIATVALGLLGVMEGEVAILPWRDPAYWGVVGALGAVSTGLGSYLYRVEAMRRSTTSLVTVAVPAMALVLGMIAWGETPLSPLTLAGGAIVLGVIAWEGWGGAPHQWMTWLPNNDRRRGDRLHCVLEAFAKGPAGAPVRIQLHDISIGGVGFRSTAQFVLGDSVIITVPMGQTRTSMTFEGRIAHGEAVASRDFPWRGGLVFEKLSDHRQQCLVEFLARVSHADEAGPVTPDA